MSTVEPLTREGDRAVPPFARIPVAAIAGVVGVAHMAVATAGAGYWFDELLMLVIGRDHLDWGSADQPPVAPLLAALMNAIAPGSIVALRVPAVLATAAAVVVAALIAREMGGDRRAQVLTAGAQATAWWITLAGHFLTPYTLEPVQWLALFWVLVRWVRVRDDRLLLLAGLVVGVAAETKFQVFVLCAALVLAVLAVGPREILRRPALWAGAVIALALAAPTLVWQAARDWPQLRMGAIVAAEEVLYGGRVGVALTLLVGAGVAGTVLAFYGTWRLLVAADARELRFLGVACLALLAFFLVTGGRPYYLGGVYGLLAAAGALGLQRRRESGRTRLRWAAWPAYAISALAAAVLLGASTTLATDAVPRQIATQMAAAYRALPPDMQRHTAVFGQSYIHAAFLDEYGPPLGLPAAYSPNRSYGYFTPPPDDADNVLLVGGSGDALRPYFADVREVADIGTDARAYLATGRIGPWEEIWPRLRTLEVG